MQERCQPKTDPPVATGRERGAEPQAISTLGQETTPETLAPFALLAPRPWPSAIRKRPISLTSRGPGIPRAEPQCGNLRLSSERGKPPASNSPARPTGWRDVGAWRSDAPRCPQTSTARPRRAPATSSGPQVWERRVRATRWRKVLNRLPGGGNAKSKSGVSDRLA